MARILLVDDEEPIRAFLKRGLEVDGHEVTVAVDGADGLDRLSEAGGAFDLLLSDIRMPMMDGIALAMAAKSAHPALRILLMTGFADQRERANGLETVVIDVLTKPFSLAEMRSKVARRWRRKRRRRRASGTPAKVCSFHPMYEGGGMPRSAVLRPRPGDFHRPPWLTQVEGRPRSVGVELEFIGPSAETTARALAAEFGGTVREVDPHSFAVEGSRLGNLGVELDARYAHPDKTDPALLGGFGPTLASWIGAAASYFLPCEIVTSPIPVERLHEVDAMVDVLRELGAKGTQDGALYAFGLHFNIEGRTSRQRPSGRC
jgi:CheY-like chemotaxis protein